MKFGKNGVILGKNMMILGKNSAIFSKIGKVYLLNWDFSANWNVPGQLGIFSANWEKIWYWKPDPVLYREKALVLITRGWETHYYFISIYYISKLDIIAGNIGLTLSM